MSQVPVAYACNPSYLGGRGRDQEDHGSKSAQRNSAQAPILKIPNTHTHTHTHTHIHIHTQSFGGVAQVVEPA
jgi:hypothetical protein